MKLTLRNRIFIVLLIALLLLVATAYYIHSRILLRSFLDLEQRQSTANIQRVVHAFDNELEHLSLVVHDWAMWDDTYLYVVDHNRAYEVSNLMTSTFAINKINLMYFFDSSGRRVWGKVVDEDLATEIALEPFDLERLPADSPLLDYASRRKPLSEQEVTGLVMTSHGPILCASRPILDTNGMGPAHGTLIMGRFITGDLVKKISLLTGTTFEVNLLAAGVSPLHGRATAGNAAAANVDIRSENDLLTVSTRLSDLGGTPIIEIVTHEAREILSRGREALRMAVIMLALGVLTALALMLLMLQRSVVTPIRLLTSVITDRRLADKPAGLPDMGACASREICQLNEEFRLLLAKLDAQNDELCEVNLSLTKEAGKLKEAESRLVVLDRLKSEFISTAAHELRTPVATIMGYTELLADPVMRAHFSDQQREEFLQEIYDSSERLSKIIDDILDVSRIEAGQAIPLDRLDASIDDLLQKVVRRFSHKSSHHLSLVIKPGLPESLRIDTQRIGQVMENLLSNAIKYSPQGSAITITAELAGRYCAISVKDHGVGMNDEQKRRIFDKFYRADTSDTAVRGLGLGMSIVKQIIVDHGGDIRVESVPGEGTLVTFTLPVD